VGLGKRLRAWAEQLRVAKRLHRSW
jgi:hypothetical protein